MHSAPMQNALAVPRDLVPGVRDDPIAAGPDGRFGRGAVAVDPAAAPSGRVGNPAATDLGCRRHGGYERGTPWDC